TVGRAGCFAGPGAVSLRLRPLLQQPQGLAGSDVLRGHRARRGGWIPQRAAAGPARRRRLRGTLPGLEAQRRLRGGDPRRLADGGVLHLPPPTAARGAPGARLRGLAGSADRGPGLLRLLAVAVERDAGGHLRAAARLSELHGRLWRGAADHLVRAAA